MLDWLKNILGDAYSEEIDKQISAEVGKGFVAKSDFNAAKEELRRIRSELDTSLQETEQLRNAGAESEALRAVIASHEETIRQMKLDAENSRKTAAVRDRLRMLGAADPDYIIWKQGGIDGFAFDEKGEPLNTGEIADSYKNNAATAFLFSAQSGGYIPAGGAPADENPFAKETFNLTEQGKLFRENPAAARKMAAAAKIKL